MAVRENDDPRSPSRQFADYVEIENFGAVNASEFLWKANVVREAVRTWPVGKVSFRDWLFLWINAAKSTME